MMVRPIAAMWRPWLVPPIYLITCRICMKRKLKMWWRMRTKRSQSWWWNVCCNMWTSCKCHAVLCALSVITICVVVVFNLNNYLRAFSSQYLSASLSSSFYLLLTYHKLSSNWFQQCPKSQQLICQLIVNVFACAWDQPQPSIPQALVIYTRVYVQVHVGVCVCVSM